MPSYTTVAIDRDGKLSETFRFIPDIEKRTSTIYLRTYIRNNGSDEHGIAKSLLTKIWKGYSIMVAN